MKMPEMQPMYRHNCVHCLRALTLAPKLAADLPTSLLYSASLRGTIHTCDRHGQVECRDMHRSVDGAEMSAQNRIRRPKIAQRVARKYLRIRTKWIRRVPCLSS